VNAENPSGERRRLEVISSSSSELLEQSPGKENSQPKVGPSTLTTILNNGQSDNRADILRLSDGYIESEMERWEIYAEAAVTSFFRVEPYSSYAQYFDTHRINTSSNVSGANHPENNDTRDTAFGAYYNCEEIQRLVCANNSTVNTVVQSLAVPTQTDIILLTVNDSKYGGSGGAIAVAFTNSAATGLILHEKGHSFGLLADEYDGALPDAPSDCATNTMTGEPNVSGLVSLDAFKWKQWLPKSVTNIPTPYTLDVSDPGLYQGSKYCNELYRPTPNSMLRSLRRPFDTINEEALILPIYDFVSSVDSFGQSTSSVTINASQSTAFAVTTLRPKSHELQTKWYVNNQEAISDASFNSDLLMDGNQTLKVAVSDTTEKVILDPFKKLIFGQIWQISNSIDLTRSAYIQGNLIYAPFGRIYDDSDLFNTELTITSTSPYQFTLQATEREIQISNRVIAPLLMAIFSR
jgi:hypothetical protein